MSCARRCATAERPRWAKSHSAGRESIIAVLPAPGDDRGMMAYTLRYQNELRDQSEYFRDIKQPPIDADSLATG